MKAIGCIEIIEGNKLGNILIRKLFYTKINTEKINTLLYINM